MKLVVLSDLHVTPEWRRFSGIHSPWRLERAVETVNADYADADLVIVNGDITHHGSEAGYRLAKASLDRLARPLWLGLGNHDRRHTFATVFGADHLSEGFAQRAARIGEYGVVMLDTNGGGDEPDSPKVDIGRLCPRRLDWFRRQLAAFSDRPVVVLLHHTVVPLEMSVDATALAEKEAFLDAVAAHGDVRLVLSGHVHLDSTAWHRGTAFVTLSGGDFTTRAVHGRTGDRREKRTPGEGEFAVILGRRDHLTTHFVRYA